MVDVVLNFTQPDESLGPTSFTRDAAHARERQASSRSRSAPGPTAVRLIDGRIGHDHAEAERTAVAELLGGGGRGFVLLRQHSAVTDWHDEAQVTGTYYKEIPELIERRFASPSDDCTFGSICKISLALGGTSPLRASLTESKLPSRSICSSCGPCRR